MKTKSIITTLAVAGLALAGCAGNDTQSSGKNIQPLFPGFDDTGMPMDDDYHPADFDDSDLTEDQIARRDAMLNDSETVGHGTFKVHSMTGAEIEFDLPTSSDNEAIQEIEEYRQTMRDDKEVTYVVIDVDNRDGTTEVGAGLSVFDPDGNKYEFEPASEYVSDLRSTPVEINEDEYELLDGTVIQWYEETDLYNHGVDLHNAHMDWIDVSERGETVLVYPDTDLPDEFSRIAVDVGYDTEDAYLAD